MIFRPQRLQPQPGQESVWDYPRPPRLELSPKHVQVLFNGLILAESQQTYRVLETSHPPVFYIPLADIHQDYLQPTARKSFCEWKGVAHYYTVTAGDRSEVDAAWYYPQPTPAFAAIANFVAFYPSRMEACYVDGEKVTAQAGDFYGGWITANIVGPFKGEAGSWGW